MTTPNPKQTVEEAANEWIQKRFENWIRPSTYEVDQCFAAFLAGAAWRKERDAEIVEEAFSFLDNEDLAQTIRGQDE